MSAVDRPLTFIPLFMERVWGGRRLAEVYGKPLEAGAVVGESWELVDRPEAQSVVRDGTLAGTTLQELWRDRRAAVFGDRGLAHTTERFPILVKLLDARDTLSVQVHPPNHLANELGGEPKHELWFLAGADPGAHLFVGLRHGVTREAFEAALTAGEDVSGMLQRIDVQTGDAIYIPSGRVHAIGGGCLIVEIQQNSDTTYRVFDFNRPGLDGKPRELHIGESLASIDWDDVEPPLASPDGETVVETPYFVVQRWSLAGPRAATSSGQCALVGALAGDVGCGGVTIAPGDFMLVPAVLDGAELAPVGDAAEVLVVTLP